jgi:nucleotide-binding universal stress UspA family protein
MEDSAAYKVIIAATDGSAAALEAVKHAVSLAKVYAASLRVVYVANVHISFHLGTYQQMAIDILKEEGNRAVDEAVGLAKDAGLQDVSGVVLTGNPRQDLVAWAEEQGADLMVLGSHGYSRFSALMIGSVADYVVHNAPCSVLLVRGEADNKTGKSDQ